jgi:hypothetical protein
MPQVILGAANILFLIVMFGVYWLAKSLIVGVGLWTLVPWLAVCFFIAWKIDKLDQSRPQ